MASNRRKLENGNALLTKKHREREAQRRREKVRHATIRIMFQQKPISDVCVEAVFDAHKETVEDVYAFVEEIISKDDKSTQNAPSFELFVAPPKRVLKRNGRDANQSLYDAGLAPAAKIFFSLKATTTTTSSFEEERNPRCSAPSVWKCFDCTTKSLPLRRRYALSLLRKKKTRRRSRSKSQTHDERPG